MFPASVPREGCGRVGYIALTATYTTWVYLEVLEVCKLTSCRRNPISSG